MIEGQARELGDEPAIVAVDRQAGKSVAFAEDEPNGGSVRTEMKESRRSRKADSSRWDQNASSSGPSSQR